MWLSSDPSTAWLKARFGGQPVGVGDPPPKPDPPGTIEERIRALELTDIVHGETLKYMLVSPEESDFEQNKISILSPIGKSLIGRREGEETTITVPAGILKYKIVKIERPG